MAVSGHGVTTSCVDSGGCTLGPACPPRAATGCNAARPAAGKGALYDTGALFDFQPVTEAQESAAGEARQERIAIAVSLADWLIRREK